MVTVITEATVGYIEESIYAIRVAAAASRRFGLEFGKFKIPQEKRSIIRKAISSSFNPNSQSYGEVQVEFPLNYVLVDARELSYLDDVIETGGSSPNFLHKITLVEPTGAFTLPSRTFHMETSGLARRFDVPGCLTKTMELKLAVTDPRGMLVKEDLLGQRVSNSNGILSNLYGQTSGTTEDPEFSIGDRAADTVLKATGQSGGSLPNSLGESVFRAAYQNRPRPFLLQKGVANQVVIGGDGDEDAGTVSGGIDLTSAIKGIGMKINHTFNIQRPSRSGTSNYNKSIQPYIFGAFIEDRTLEVSLVLDATSDVIEHMEDSQLEVLDNQIFIKVQKDNNSDDWISYMFSSAGDIYNPLADYEAEVGFIEDTQFHTLGWAPQTLNILANNDNATLRSAT